MKTEELYLARYKTGKTGVLVSGILFGVSLLFTVFCLLAGSSDFIVWGILALLFSLGGVVIGIRSYREIALYQNRMEVLSMINGIILEVVFKDIAQIGFLKGYHDYTRGGRNAEEYQNSYTAISELIILMRDGARLVFSDDEYDSLHEVCVFIQERRGQS